MTTPAQLAASPLDSLRQDHAVLAQILWKIYLVILEDALKTLDALIDYFDQKEKTASIGG